ncbi:SMC-Scp complex subunit ScpB [Microbulbifer guangxiensis]|uniref:SMC-Scp complex subunit ScpB n=1 Tax=Microbulbifer guangxiensis TaxID=2904249 RepID=UPI001EFFA8F3|nr:SMC-Scp complex subunit ScpB [Microbulbifer guangxiensis]
MTIAPELLRRIVEGALLASGQPLSEDRLLSLIDEGERPEKSALREVLQEIAENCAERGFELCEVASGWRFQVPEDLAPWVNRLWEEKPQKYSRAVLETLAIIAYRQPITRGDIEEIRGVAVSSHIVKTLSERGWIKVVGQRDVPGRPSLYATTREFLDYFNLRTLDDLPTLAEIRDIDSLNQALDLDQHMDQGGAASDGEAPEGEVAAEHAAPESAEHAEAAAEVADEPDTYDGSESGVESVKEPFGDESVADTAIAGESEQSEEGSETGPEVGPGEDMPEARLPADDSHPEVPDDLEPLTGFDTVSGGEAPEAAAKETEESVPEQEESSAELPHAPEATAEPLNGDSPESTTKQEEPAAEESVVRRRNELEPAT